MDINTITKHREWLHKNAELSFCEFNTCKYICSVLSELGIKHRVVAETGVLAEIGDNFDNAILLRADIDALPIKEESGEDFSARGDVMHACGHDMHAASLLGALGRLSENPPVGRTVLGLFQPGEEVAPGGAIGVIESGVLDDYNIRAVVGVHTSPELAVGEIGVKSGAFMASTDEVHITVNGKGGHAAKPENLRNPVWAAVEILSELHKIQPPKDIQHILAFGRIEALGATNVIPDSVKIEGTFRTFSEEWRENCKNKMQELAREIAEKHSLNIEVKSEGGYPSVYNNPELTAKAEEILEGENLVQIPYRMTAEDFGHFSVRYPSLFLRFGVTPKGEEQTFAHTSKFKAASDALEYGTRIYELLAKKI